LLVSYYFPPRFSVGGKRAHRFARYLPEHGWSTTVLTAAAPPGERLDPTLLEGELPSCRVLHGYITEDEVARAPRRKVGSDGTIAEPTAAWQPLAKKGGLARLRGELRLVPPIGPDVRRLPRLAYRIARAAEEAGAEVIFASGSPWETVVAGVVAGRALDLPTIVDFRDPWSFGPVVAARPSWAQLADRLAERAVLRAATALTVTSETTRDAYARLAPGLRVECVRNGFDPAVRVSPRRGDRATIVHFGNCYCGRTLEPFLRALAAVARRRGLGPTDVRLLNLGRVAEEDLRLAAELGIGALFEHATVMPYAEGLGVVAGADLALLQGYGDDPWFLPAKLYDYLLARVPVLSISTSAELASILERTRLGAAHDASDLAALERGIEAALDARAAGRRLASPDEAELEALSARAAAAKLARLLDELAPAHPRGAAA
jgi:hypothetical protein